MKMEYETPAIEALNVDETEFDCCDDHVRCYYILKPGKIEECPATCNS